MRIAFGTMDWSKILGPGDIPTPGGSGWYRAHLPHRALKDAGIESYIGRLLFNRKEKRLGVREWGAEDGSTDHFECDIVVIQRCMLNGLAEDIGEARRRGQTIITDVDDWFFGLASQNIASRTINAHPYANLTFFRKVLAASDLVMASTPYLGKRLSSFVPRVRVVRNHIDLDVVGRWDPARVAQRDPMTLGWAGAVPWRSGDLETLRGVMTGVRKATEEKGVRFHHSGHMTGGDWDEWEHAGIALGLDDAVTSTSPMAPITEWPAEFRHFDVGIVPLSDRPFNLAKSAVKGMEYAAAGKPFIAQATPEYEWLKVRGVGRVAGRPKDWVRQLDVMLGMSGVARDHEAQWNMDAMREAGLTTESLAERWLEMADDGLKLRVM